MRIGLQKGSWTSAIGLVGGGGVTVAPENSLAWYFSIVMVIVGVGVLVWGVTWDGVQWWRQRKPGKRNGITPISLEGAIRYLALKSKWGAENDISDSRFIVNLQVMLRDALASGDIKARGRFYDELRGGIADPPYHPRVNIEKEFWKSTPDLGGFYALFPPPHAFYVNKVPDIKNVNQGMHDIILDKGRLELLWPPIPPKKGKFFESANEQALRRAIESDGGA